MSSTNNTTLGGGTNGSPQEKLEEQTYPNLQKSIESKQDATSVQRKYDPSPKHEENHNWGSVNPIKTQEEGQLLLDTGYVDNIHKQIFNITDGGVIVKFQPDGTSENGYHAYKVSKPRDIPAIILKQLLNDGKITRPTYNKLRKGKI